MIVACSPAGDDDTIRIGVTQPLTGAVAASGNYVVQGAEIAAFQFDQPELKVADAVGPVGDDILHPLVQLLGLAGQALQSNQSKEPSAAQPPRTEDVVGSLLNQVLGQDKPQAETGTR